MFGMLFLFQAASLKERVALLHAEWKVANDVTERDISTEFETRLKLRKLEAACQVCSTITLLFIQNIFQLVSTSTPYFVLIFHF